MLGIVCGVLFAMFLGVASIFSKRGLEHGPYSLMVLISLFMAAPIFLVLAVITSVDYQFPLAAVGYAVVGGALGAFLARALYHLGIHYLGPGKSLTISATSPMFGVVSSFLILDETITILILGGTVLVTVGIAIMSRDVLRETNRGGYSVLVVLYPLGYAVLSAISITLQKISLNMGLTSLEAGTVTMSSGLLVAIPIFWHLEDWTIGSIDRTALRYFVVASIFTTMAFISYFFGLQIANVSVFFPIAQTQPLFAVLLSALFLGQLEIIGKYTIVGSAIIVSGAAFVVVG